MRSLIQVLTGLTLIITLFACGDTSNVGSNILSDEVKIVIDSNFTATGSSVMEAYVQSRTTTQLLGVIDAKEYGTFSSDFVTQFMPAASIDTTTVGVENLDSMQLIMAIPAGSIVGDSIIPMGLNVYTLNKPLPNPIYSNFDPEGYYDPTPVASKIYTATAIHEEDAQQKSAYRYIYVDLPLSLARYIYTQYRDNPNSFLSPSDFTKIFPGFYVANSFGSGRVVRISSSIMRMYFHIDSISESTGRDTTYLTYGNYFGVTPEIITNNIINYRMADNLKSLIDQGRAIVSAPTGSDVELVFPALDVVNSYLRGAGSTSLINTLTLSIPAITIDNNYNINPPQTMLMVLKSEKDKFFQTNALPDGITSFYTVYDSKSKTYGFGSLASYLEWLLNKDEITPDDYTFVLTPISLNMATNSNGYYGSSSYLESVAPYVQEPSMVELDVKNSKIILTYSRESQKN